jgi:glycosyltransferase involved in cell wall biosynthesis
MRHVRVSPAPAVRRVLRVPVDSPFPPPPTPRVTVVTVVLNGAGTIRDTIDSVLAQTYPAIEHWVIDGASTDGTPQLLATYGDRLPHWTSEPDTGIADAFNKGVRRATGDYLHFLSADDAYASPTALAEVMDAAAARDWPEVFYGDCLMVDHSTGAALWRVPKHAADVSLSRGRAQPHPSTFMHRRYFERFGDFDTSYRVAMDLELFLRGIPVVGTTYVPVLVARVRTGGLSMTQATIGYAEAVRAMDAHGTFRTPLHRWLMRGRFATRRWSRAAVVRLGLYAAVGHWRRVRQRLGGHAG